MEAETWYMDKFLCPDDQHPSESSTNSLVHKYELNMRNFLHFLRGWCKVLASDIYGSSSLLVVSYNPPFLIIEIRFQNVFIKPLYIKLLGTFLFCNAYYSSLV